MGSRRDARKAGIKLAGSATNAGRSTDDTMVKLLYGLSPNDPVNLGIVFSLVASQTVSNQQFSAFIVDQFRNVRAIGA